MHEPGFPGDELPGKKVTVRDINRDRNMKIGELVKQSGIAAETLRYWEREGLLSPAGRSPSGYRNYSKENLAQVEFIKRAKSVGFTLSEIGELLSIRVDPESHTCGEVKRLADSKLRNIERKIEELGQMHHALARISDICCGGDASAIRCTILNALERGNGRSHL
jgi:MerR family Zn(II)-responsive transcriptional regulator of zntA